MNKILNLFKQECDPIHSKINTVLLLNLYQQGVQVGVSASFVCSLLILLSHLTTGFNYTIIVWFTYLFIVAILRLTICYFFNRQQEPEKNMNFWLYLYLIGVILNGLGWGILSTPLFAYESSLQQKLSLLILCGMTAGSVPLLSHFVITSVGFLVPALLPLMISQFQQDSAINILFGLSVVVYLSYLIVLSLKMNRLIKKSLGLRFENDKLLESLSHAKSKLEIINKELVDTATHDPLTHSANRNLFVERLNNAIVKSTITRKNLFLFYIDIDHFKEINDKYGHIIGDQLLIIVTQRIEHLLRKEDLLSRLGGDEFTIIFESTNDDKVIANIADRICKSITRTIQSNNITINTHISIGISHYPNDGKDADAIIKCADDAMYYIKQRGGNGYAFYKDISKSINK